MPELNGAILSSPQHPTLRNPTLSADDETFGPTWHDYPFQQFDTPRWPAGASTRNGTQASLAQAKTGAKLTSYFDDFYLRVHVVPSSIDVGNVVTNQTRDFYVWNAWLDAKVCASISPVGTLDGITLTGQAAPPLLYAPLQQRAYQLQVNTAGDPLIDGHYDFAFPDETPKLTVAGRRIVLWLIRPDWAQGVTERLEWQTDVLTGYDGNEQRVRLRTNARRTVEMDFIAQGHDARIAETLLFGWGARKYCLPVWMERDILSVPVASGATSITVVDAALKDYRVGGLVVLWASTTQAEAIEISAISGNTLTLKTPTSRAYPAGTSVCPGMLARIEGDAPVRRQTDNLFETRLRFLDEQATDRAAAEIGPTWQSYAVLNEQPDRADDVSETLSRTLALLDSIAGMIAVEDTIGQPIIRRTYSWLISGRAAIDTWKKWAAARAGRMNALWLPTFADDLEVMATIGSSHTSITVRNALISRYVGAHPLRAAIRIETTSGAVYHALVTGVTEIDETTESLTIAESLGVTLAPSDILRVMWMGLARLESDAVEFHYETDNIARLSATFRMVAA